MENSEPETKIDFNVIFYQKIKKSCKIFEGFSLILTYVMVIHGNILS